MTSQTRSAEAAMIQTSATGHRNRFGSSLILASFVHFEALGQFGSAGRHILVLNSTNCERGTHQAARPVRHGRGVTSLSGEQPGQPTGVPENDWISFAEVSRRQEIEDDMSERYEQAFSALGARATA